MSAFSPLEPEPIETAPSIEPIQATKPVERADNIGRGIVYILLSSVLYAAMNTTVKLLSPRIGPVEIGFFRQIVSFFAISLIIARQGGLSLLRTRRLSGHLFRGVIGNSSMMVMYLSVIWLPLADATALSFATPLFVTILSIPLLGEKVGLHRWGAVLVGLAGVIVMTNPGMNWFSAGQGAGAAMGVLNAFTGALMMVTIRQLGKTENPLTIVFYFALIGIVLFGAVLPFFWVQPTLWEWLGLAAVGMIGVMFQLILTHAYRHAPASSLAPFGYSSILWSTLLGYFIWDQLPGPRMLTGAAIVIASGLYIVYRETRKLAGLNINRP